MKLLPALLLPACAALSAATANADVLLSRKSHTDAYTIKERETPAKDSTSLMWIGKDRLRLEAENRITIVRLDQKKLYLIDAKEKTAQVIDLPFELKQYLPPEQAAMAEQMMAMNKPTVTVTTSDETRKVHDWTAKKFEMSITGTRGGSTKDTIWATKDAKIDATSFMEMMRAMTSVLPGGSSISDEMRKIEGVPVLTERTHSMNGTDIKSTEEVTSIEEKNAPAGAYEVPADFTTKPFDPMSQMRGRGEGRGRRPGADAKGGEGHEGKGEGKGGG